MVIIIETILLMKRHEKANHPLTVRAQVRKSKRFQAAIGHEFSNDDVPSEKSFDHQKI